MLFRSVYFWLQEIRGFGCASALNMDLCCGEGKYICCCAVYGVGTQLSLGLREQRGLEGEG